MRKAFYAGLLLLAPVPLLAAGLVPDCGFGTGQFFCQACHIAGLVHNILVLFIQLAVAGAAIMFMYAGFLYLTASANKSNLDSAKHIFSQVLVGLVLVLAAWLVIDLVMRVFTNQSLQVWTQFKCVEVKLIEGKFEFEESDPPAESVGNPTPANIAQCAQGQGLTHDKALEYLKGANITVTSTAGAGGVRGDCSGKGCTNLTNICPNTVQGLLDIARESGCPITVYGAAEGGDAHAANSWHGKGCAFDVNNSQCLGEWLNKNGAAWGVTQVCTTPGDAKYRQNCNYNEKNGHFHITFCKSS